MLVEELEDSRNPKLFHIIWRKPFACPEWSSAPGGFDGRYCAKEARAIEGVDVALLLVTPSVM